MDREELSAIIKEAMAAVVTESHGTPEHEAHHLFIAQLVEEKKIKLEEKKLKLQRWEDIRRQVTGWAIIAMLGSIGTFGYHIYQYVMNDKAK